jgi:hypothetical protein
MRQSKAGKKLTAELAAVSGPIYARDPVRYKRLIRWIWQAQATGWPDEAIAEAMKLADAGLDQATDWWSYLTFLLSKAKGRVSEAESDMHKTEVGKIVDDLKEFAEWKAKQRRL